MSFSATLGSKTISNHEFKYFISNPTLFMRKVMLDFANISILLPDCRVGEYLAARLCHVMWDSHLPGVSRYVGFVPVKRDGRCAWTGLDGVIIRIVPRLAVGSTI